MTITMKLRTKLNCDSKGNKKCYIVPLMYIEAYMC
jgi:hypothetical protein